MRQRLPGAVGEHQRAGLGLDEPVEVVGEDRRQGGRDGDRPRARVGLRRPADPAAVRRPRSTPTASPRLVTDGRPVVRVVVEAGDLDDAWLDQHGTKVTAPKNGSTMV